MGRIQIIKKKSRAEPRDGSGQGWRQGGGEDRIQGPAEVTSPPAGTGRVKRRKGNSTASPARYPQPLLVRRTLEAFLVLHQALGLCVYQAPVTGAVLRQTHRPGDP